MKLLINPSLNHDIWMKKTKLATRQEYSNERHKMILDDIRSIGDTYSFWIENPELRRSLLTENKSPKSIRKEARKGIDGVHDGWYFLCQKGAYGNFVETLNPEILKRVSGHILHEKKPQFRDKSVTLNYLHYTPPAPGKISQKIGDAINRIKDFYLNKKEPLVAAITAHLEIAAIQPFMDGNKRVARLIQDRILHDVGLPPVVIQAGEGKYYRDLLGRALPAYSEKDIGGQKEFYDYCASKVNNGLDSMLGDLQEEPYLISYLI